VQETKDFSKFMACPHGQGGLSKKDIFRTRGKRINFSRFCADVLYGRPLRSQRMWLVNQTKKEGSCFYGCICTRVI